MANETPISLKQEREITHDLFGWQAVSQIRCEKSDNPDIYDPNATVENYLVKRDLSRIACMSDRIEDFQKAYEERGLNGVESRLEAVLKAIFSDEDITSWPIRPGEQPLEKHPYMLKNIVLKKEDIEHLIDQIKKAQEKVQEAFSNGQYEQLKKVKNAIQNPEEVLKDGDSLEALGGSGSNFVHF